MSVLKLRSVENVRYDAVSLGEIMLRLDPGERRIRTANSFNAWDGGGEYNVARGLSRTFGLRTAVITALVRNEIGALLEGLIMSAGVDTSLIRWADFDSVGRTARNGLNFTERGFGVRGALGVSDRGHTAISQLTADQIDTQKLFESDGVRWLHTGGIYAALSPTAADTALQVVTQARASGTAVSYDLNYRESLWSGVGGRAAAREVNRAIAPSVDVLVGNEEDYMAALGFATKQQDLETLTVADYAELIDQVVAAFPQLSVVAITLRKVKSASRNDWGAIAWSKESGLVQAIERKDLDVLDRVGGGDSFASGLIWGLLDGQSLQRSVELGAAHGALAITTPGDATMATLKEVIALADGAGQRIRR